MGFKVMLLSPRMEEEEATLGAPSVFGHGCESSRWPLLATSYLGKGLYYA
jgi:hypothetical protein